MTVGRASGSRLRQRRRVERRPEGRGIEPTPTGGKAMAWRGLGIAMIRCIWLGMWAKGGLP